ncbi:MAG: 6-pyruvoyl tetrahydrobiopterin synthase [Ignavibacteria bacterium CG1_02_37_35]|nr:6-carboxytetrahydropterin synthase [Ignavibacteria bacterium]OIO14172.1 MAG: 6-pyruvoyl tetrahydrobiopterin synthase [Ignavibacteria bacterium CG1_02_37_35]PJC59881.1 MAG: 6-pyruvoyl tetrahydrobiopterin synthase [Ignavibacteria bacterium CG_4_9_14_0_2_um_filter_37_13]
MVYVTRREVFSASHRLYNDTLTAEENISLYDKCANSYGHGHNFILEVVVCGEIEQKSGYVIDLKILKKIIQDIIIKKVDHHHLNYEVDFLKDIIPTAENICIAFWKELYHKIPVGKLYSVKLFETENNYVEYRGE